MKIELTGTTPDQLRRDFLSLKSTSELARLLQVPPKQLMYHTRVVKPAAKYKEFNIAKRSGASRKITSPATALKILQRKLNQVLACVYEPRQSVHGFVEGRSIVTNAKFHMGARYVLNVDLKDFFPSINFGRVRGLFMAKPYSLPASVATLLAQLACHDSLPQGAPSSPIISNMICARMDSRLQKLARRFNCKYTRYADDLTFSTTLNTFPRALARSVLGPTGEVLEIGAELAKVIVEEGFQINPDKVRLATPKQRQVVTGLTINRFPNVRRKYMSQVRAMLHAWDRHGYDRAEEEFRRRFDSKRRNPGFPEPSFRRVLKGKLDFLQMVRGKDDPIYVRLMRELQRLEPKYGRRHPVGRHTPKHVIFDSLWVLETAEDTNSGSLIGQGTGFYLQGIGVVTCSHVVRPSTRAFRADNFSKKYPIKIVAEEPAVDLAILEIGAPQEIELVKGDSRSLQTTDSVAVLGYPNYRLGDKGLLNRGSITGYRTVSGIERMLVDAHIVAGNSGGPVLDSNNNVVGVAVTGADFFASAGDTENHGVIPIEALQHLPSPAADSGTI